MYKTPVLIALITFIVMMFIQFVGMIFIAFILIYLILGFIYSRIKNDIESKDTTIEQNGMPILRPIPIPSREQTVFRRLLVWLFKVRRWSLVEDWKYELEDKSLIVIPKDYEFDGASIPRIFWSILSPVGLLFVPALIHDYGYEKKHLLRIEDNGNRVEYKSDNKKEDWDNLFREVGDKVNGCRLINGIAYWAVRIGGHKAWNK
ncbi:DUF1353 domain-containing protein [candidate division KSB1 bacterium]